MISTYTFVITIIITFLMSLVFVVLINFKHITKINNKADFRVLLVQLIALLVWIGILGKVFYPGSGVDPIIGLAIFTTSVVIGIFLIRSIFKEISTQDEIDLLIKKLNNTNEKIVALDKQKTEFVSIASHQLRSPLTVVQGYTSMMLEGDFGKVPANLQEPLTRVHSASASLGFLINDFLNISRIEKGQLEYTFDKVNVTALLNDLFKEFTLVAKNHNLVLREKYDETKEIFVKADLGKLKQVLSNLIDNAIKYTLKGYVELDLQEKAGKVLISIKDTGIGMDKKTKAKLFEKFSRSQRAGLVNVYGSGFGLYVAKVMTEAQSAKIWVESEGNDKGSTFFVEFEVMK